MAEKDFFTNVYAVVRLIPSGRVCSYGVIARYLGAIRSARMVGWAMNNAHNIDPPVPAHRVVNRVGVLSGKHHFSDPKAMEELLASEGVEIKNDQVQDLDRYFWDPIKELEI